MDELSSEDENPYSSPKPPVPEAGAPRHRAWLSNFAMMGATWSLVSTFPLAALIGLVFRFPVPMVGYLSGVQAVIPSLIAVVVYGVFTGGFLLIGGFGALAGHVAANLMGPPIHRQRMAARLASLMVTILFLAILSILDRMIGAW